MGMGESATGAPHARPYWHVDAKWVSGLLLVPVLGTALLLNALAQMTTEDRATDTMALAFALMLSRNGLDDETEIVEMRRVLAASPNGTVRPISGLDLTISNEDVKGTPREIRLRFFRRFAEPLYRDGPVGLAALTDDPQMRGDILQGAGPLAILGLETHRTIERVVAILVVVCVLLLVPLIAFSSRFGRIGSAGVALVAASIPGAAIAAVTLLPGVRAPITPPGREPELTALAGYLVGQMVPMWGDVMAQVFFPALLAGAGLVVLSMVANVVWLLRRQKLKYHVRLP